MKQFWKQFFQTTHNMFYIIKHESKLSQKYVWHSRLDKPQPESSTGPPL